jgi:enoyl-CoA hydratase
MTVYVEKDGPVTTIVLSRPEVRNTVDREAAQDLADAFPSFEIDKAERVAVFCGDQGQFCAGADLKKSPKARQTGWNLKETAPWGLPACV